MTTGRWSTGWLGGHTLVSVLLLGGAGLLCYGLADTSWWYLIGIAIFAVTIGLVVVCVWWDRNPEAALARIQELITPALDRVQRVRQRRADRAGRG